MVGRKTALKIRKAHRYLGLFIGIQFLMWTISGLYFSWTDIDDIHGDQFKKEKPKQTSFNNLLGTAQLNLERPIQNLELLEIAGEPYYWINEEYLYNAVSGIKKNGITKFIKPIAANQYQSFENASILIFLYKHNPITGMAPKKILKNAIVIGP